MVEEKEFNFKSLKVILNMHREIVNIFNLIFLFPVMYRNSLVYFTSGNGSNLRSDISNKTKYEK